MTLEQTDRPPTSTPPGLHDHALALWPGRNWPLGATWNGESTNIAFHSPEATDAWVCLFEESTLGGPQRETRIRLTERSLGTWHCALPDVGPGALYGFRVDGPWEPERGLRFNPHQLLLDPYARAISGDVVAHPAIYAHDVADPHRRNETDSAPYVARGVVVHDDFDWGQDTLPHRRWRDTAVYELHVKGFTALHDRIPQDLRGTYAGLGHPVVTDYLTDLGITAVELLPVHQFFSEPRLADVGLSNYWGYNSLGFFAPHNAYSASGDRGGQVREFKEMVKAFHTAGIEVFLDVVYNHTAEGGPDGPSLSFRGLDDLGFYQRVSDRHGNARVPDTYWDVTGCGNTVDTTQRQSLRLILDSLRYWATEMHVDGFRFDLASALTRTRQRVDMNSQLLTAIGQDPVLRHTKLVAEPWDASTEGYRVGDFPPPWVEWNDQYRDTLRDYWRGQGDIRAVATRLAGSSDLYLDDGRSPYASVNFVTAHDGFTLRDLVSYDEKHNEANGEDNRDGTDNNRSWNCGVEGETDDEDVLALRRRQAANLMVTLCLSNGVPMLVAGDERGRTQGGNNNAYAQDNETSWVDWSADDAWLEVHEQTRLALRLRREHETLRQRHWFEGRPAVEGGPKDLVWVHPAGHEMTGEDWADRALQTIGMFVSAKPLRNPGPRGEVVSDRSFLIWVSAAHEPVEIVMPQNPWVEDGEVALCTDPAHSPGDPVRVGDRLTLGPRAVLVCIEP